MTPETLASHLRATCAFMLSGAGVSVPCTKTHCLLHEAARMLEEQAAKIDKLRGDEYIPSRF